MVLPFFSCGTPPLFCQVNLMPLELSFFVCEVGTVRDKDDIFFFYHKENSKTFNGYEFGQALGVGDGQGSLVYCNPWGHEESDTLSE